MLTSWSEQSTPAELSMASVLMRPPRERVLDAAALREAEVAALADDAAAQLPRVDADRVVGPVADVGVALLLALTYVPMPPIQSRSTGARRIARISSSA